MRFLKIESILVCHCSMLVNLFTAYDHRSSVFKLNLLGYHWLIKLYIYILSIDFYDSNFTFWKNIQD